jgi:hypothetical protein
MQNVRYEIVVPDLKGDGSPPSPQLDGELLARVLEMDGGFTTFPATGGWVNPDGEVEIEAVTVYAIDVLEAFTGEWFPEINNIASFVRVEWQQHSVYVTSRVLSNAWVNTAEGVEFRQR